MISNASLIPGLVADDGTQLGGTKGEGTVLWKKLSLD